MILVQGDGKGIICGEDELRVSLPPIPVMMGSVQSRRQQAERVT